MKKQLIILAVCLLIAGGLGTALWFLLAADSEGEEESPSASSGSSVILLEKTKDDLDKLAVKNEAGEYTVKNLGDSQYTIEGLEEAPLSGPMLSSAANCATAVTANSVVAEAPANLADYGLDSPRVTLTSHFTDASTFTYLIGDDAPGNNGVYVKKADADTVYLFSSYTFNNVLKGKLDFIDKAVTTSPVSAQDAQGAQTLPTAVTFGGSSRAEEIVIVSSDSATEAEKAYNLSTFQMTKPKSRAVDSQDATGALSSLLSIAADGVAAYKPTEAELAQFGLAEPYSTVAFTYLDENGEEKDVSIRASAVDAQGDVFLYRDGVPVVYKKAAAGLPWYSVQYSELLSKLQLMPFIDDVKTLSFESAGVSHVFTLENEGEELAVTCDGAPVDTDSFRTFYQNLIGVPSEEFTTDTPPDQGTALVRVTYAYRDASRASDTMALLPGVQQRKAFISINGEAEFYTRDTYVERIRANCENLIAGREVTSLY